MKASMKDTFEDAAWLIKECIAPFVVFVGLGAIASSGMAAMYEAGGWMFWVYSGGVAALGITGGFAIACARGLRDVKLRSFEIERAEKAKAGEERAYITDTLSCLESVEIGLLVELYVEKYVDYDRLDDNTNPLTHPLVTSGAVTVHPYEYSTHGGKVCIENALKMSNKMRSTASKHEDFFFSEAARIKRQRQDARSSRERLYEAYLKSSQKG